MIEDRFDELFRGTDDDEQFDAARAEKMTELKSLHPGSPKPVGGEYGPDKFYTYSKNDHDHSVNVQVTMRPQLSNLLGRVVEMRLIPEYTSKQAIIRDAIHHRLAYIADHYADFEGGEMLAYERIATTMQMRRESRRTVNSVISEAEAELNEIVRSGDWDDLQHELDSLDMQLLDLPEKQQQRLAALVLEFRAKLKRFGRTIEDGE